MRLPGARELRRPVLTEAELRAELQRQLRPGFRLEPYAPGILESANTDIRARRRMERARKGK